MANFIPSQYMSLPVPVVGVDPGPDYANNTNSSLTLIDQHNHSPGSGVQINPSGININAALPFNGLPATLLGYAGFSPQGAGISAPVNYSLYVQPSTGSANGDLFYQDGKGNTVQITLGGTINATSSGISSGTASASFISSVLVVTQSTGVGAPIDASSYILRYNGSYPTPSGNAIVLAAPTSLSGSYQITFPATTPGATLPVSMDTSGVLSTGQIVAAQIATGTITGVQIATNSVSGNQIALSTITESNMAPTSVGTAELIPASIIGSKLTNNINIPGLAPQAASKNLVVSNTNATNSLAIVRGVVNSNGTINAGEGFSVSHPSAGVYTITYSSAFTDTAAVVATPNTSANGAFTSTQSASGVTITLVSSGTATNSTFSFIAIGQRV